MSDAIRLTIDDAKAIAANPSEAADDHLEPAWKAYAGKISYHHADDSTKEWHLATALMPSARAIEVEMRKRGLPRPTGEYLLSKGERIDWETGEWSRGWDYKKAKAS